MRKLTGKLKVTRKRLGILTMILSLAMIIGMMTLFSSCCEDCPTCPDGTLQPYKGWLYAAEINRNRLYQIDTETDSVVDSLAMSDCYPGFMDVSQDGKYLAVGMVYSAGEGTTIVYDAQTLDPIADLGMLSMPTFVTSENILLIFGAYKVKIFSIPQRNTFLGQQTCKYKFRYLRI